MDALDIRKKKKCYSRGYAIARCQAKTTLKSYWHELRDHQKYSKKMAMKTGTHTQVPVFYFITRRIPTPDNSVLRLLQCCSSKIYSMIVKN